MGRENEEREKKKDQERGESIEIKRKEKRDIKGTELTI